MSDIEFFAKFNPKPFKSLAMIEKERIEELKKATERDKLKKAGKLPPDPKAPETREPFYE